MRVVYWGIGKFFHDAKRRMDMFVDAFRDEVAAFVDNNSRLWGTFFDGKIVMSPQNIKKVKWDRVIITSQYVNEIKKQLIDDLGIETEKVLTFDEYYWIKYTSGIYHEKYKNDIFRKTSNFNTSKLVVYTAITGNYDNLKEPLFIDSSITYVCFTNNKKLRSKIWNIEQIKNGEFSDRKLARVIKLRPHVFFKEYETSVWVDGKFEIDGDLREYIKRYEKKQSILCFPHFERNCIYSEAAQCICSARGNKRDLINQISHYYSQGYPFDYGLYETGCMVREHNNDLCNKIMCEWEEEITKYSLRDQVSFPYVCWKNSFEPDICDLFINDNKWLRFVWHNRYY
jgi:hypothetical protein